MVSQEYKPDKWRVELKDNPFLQRLKAALDDIDSGRPQPDRELVTTYSEHDNTEYSRGMFIDTVCEEAKSLDYYTMEHLLICLCSENNRNARMFSIGKSQGYGGPDKALHIYGMKIFPDWLRTKRKPEKTVLLVAGHHGEELSGPITVYEIARRILESYRSGNGNIKEMLERTQVILIPQVDSDYAANLDKATGDEDDYIAEGYSWCPATGNRRGQEYARSHHMNAYSDYHAELFPENAAVKRLVDTIALSSSPLYLSFDYHEGSSGRKYEVLESDSDGKYSYPLYVFAEIVKSYKVPNEQEIQWRGEFILDPHMEPIGGSLFSTYVGLKGANSFLAETPHRILCYTLAQRIEMNLIATDRILARHYLGI